MASSAVDLAVLLEQHLDTITERGADTVCRLLLSRDRKSDPEDVNACVLWGWQAMIEMLASGSQSALEEHLREICLQSRQEQCDVRTVIEVLLSCREAALPAIRKAYGDDLAGAWRALSQLDSCFNWAAGYLGEAYTEQASQLLQDQHARMAMMLRVIQAATGKLDLDEVLNRIGIEIESVVENSHCAYYLVEQQRFAGSAGTLSHFPYPVDDFMWEVVETNKPLVSHDAPIDPRILEAMPRWGQFSSVLGVPMAHDDRVLAMVIVTTPHRYVFQQREIDLIQGMARTAALAVTNVMLYHETEQMAMLEEGTRIARNLHDDLAQVMGYMQLRASLVGELLSRADVDQAGSELSELQDAITLAHKSLRETIFDLRAITQSELGFLETLRTYLADYRVQYGVDVQLDARDEDEGVLAGYAQVQIMRIIQEALSNVRKHAGASHVCIHIRRESNMLHVRVADDGQGFIPSSVSNDGRQHFGLQVMHERAESAGGSLLIESKPDQGTRVSIELPWSASVVSQSWPTGVIDQPWSASRRAGATEPTQA